MIFIYLLSIHLTKVQSFISPVRLNILLGFPIISSSSNLTWFHSPQLGFSSHLSVVFPMESIVLNLRSLNHWSYFLMPPFSRPLNCNYFLNSMFFLNSLLRVLSFHSHCGTWPPPQPPPPQFNYRPRLFQQSPNLSSNSRFPHSYGGIKLSRILLISCRSKMWLWDFLVVQWLRFHAPVQGTQCQSLAREWDLTCYN